MNNRTKELTFTAIMIALSVILSYVPIPGFPTLSFDSLPGYFVAVFLNPVLGGIVATVGHLATALIHGFPLGFPSHLIIAFSMFVAAYALGKIYVKKYQYTIVFAVAVATVLNIYLSMPFMVYLLGVPFSVLAPLQVPLLIASLVNIILAVIISFSLQKAEVEIY